MYFFTTLNTLMKNEGTHLVKTLRAYLYSQRGTLVWHQLDVLSTQGRRRRGDAGYLSPRSRDLGISPAPF